MEFDEDKYKVWKLPNPMMLHWVINPALAVNELILGQRFPKVMLIDKDSDAPLVEKQYVPCPHCKTIHNGMLWSKKASFANWFGLFCPTCEKSIPCLWNLTSLVLLAVTFPLWGWFRRPLESKWRGFKKSQLNKQNDVNPTDVNKPVTVNKAAWFKAGLMYGAGMFGFLMLFKVFNGEEITNNLAIELLICGAAGVLFGGAMKLLLGSKMKSKGD